MGTLTCITGVSGSGKSTLTINTLYKAIAKELNGTNTNPSSFKTIEGINNLEKVDLFICGHSHILKVINDKKYNLLHINPGAIGKHGFHNKRTMVRFEIDGKKIENLEIIEFNR